MENFYFGDYFTFKFFNGSRREATRANKLQVNLKSNSSANQLQYFIKIRGKLSMLPSKLRQICQKLNGRIEKSKNVNICGAYTGSYEIFESFDDMISVPNSII